MSQKAVAVEIGCASSTVASSAARCLHLLGLDRTSRAAPMSIVMMAHASQAMRSAGTKLPEVTHLAESVLVSIERPDLAVGALLSRGEAEVLRLRVDGLMLRAIASERATSERTVANQLASAYTKLGVSGRSELLASLVQGSWRRRVGMVRGAA
jgi:DNA-binding NarL/FixJ family response regulator